MLKFNNTYARLPERFYERINPTPVTNPELLYWNLNLASELGVDGSLAANQQELALIFSGNKIPTGAEPIAQAYAGHQFAHFVPQLGDGRAILLGELESAKGTLYDIQLKGSGRTKFSRRGDGRAALGPMMRECLISEFLHAVGIPTTRSLALVASGEYVIREEPLPGAVLTRVAASHIRVGTFEYFHARGDLEAIKILTDYAVDRHYPHIKDAANPYLSFLNEVIRAQAELVAKWIQVGFIHGVMNTDNMAVSGESIDFGPCAFMDSFDPNAVFSSIDQHGRYAYQQQPTIAQWNLTRLAECLLPLVDGDAEKAKSQVLSSLENFESLFKDFHLKGFAKKLGLTKPTLQDSRLVQNWLELLAKHKIDFTLAFVSLFDSKTSDKTIPQTEEFNAWRDLWHARLEEENIDKETLKKRLQSANPQIIPRNHQIERAINAAYNDGDLSQFNDLMRVIQKPFDNPSPQDQHFGLAPKPEERVLATFCGT